MKGLRIAAVVLSALLATVSVFGFLAERSLTDNTGFGESLEESLADPKMRQEISDELRASIQDSLTEVVEQGGLPAVAISTVGVDTLTETIADALTSPQATDVFTQWVEVLHDGLAAYTLGQPDPNVTVSGSTISVKLNALAEPIFAQSPLSGLSGPAARVLGDTTVSLDVGNNLERRLNLAGAAAEARWVTLVLAVVFAAAAVALGRYRWRWATATVFFMGLTLLVFAGIVALLNEPGPSSLPALTSAITSASTGSGAAVMVVVGACLFVIGGVGWYLTLRRSNNLEATSEH